MKAILIEGTVKGDPAMYLDRTQYPKKNGLYIFDDGAMYMIVDVIEGSVGMGFAIPRECIVKDYTQEENQLMANQSKTHNLVEKLIEAVEYINDEQSDKSFERKVENMLETLGENAEAFENLNEDIRNGLNELGEKLMAQKGGGSELKLSDLTKLIAVAQKPELIDKKVN